MTLRVVLADDHQLVREGLRALLAHESDLDVIGLAEDGMVAVRLVRQLQPDVLVTDIAMPGLNGIEAIRRVRADQPSVRIVCMSMHADPRSVMAAIDAGASGYVPKDSSCKDLARAIREVAAGQIHLSPSLMGVVVDEIRLRKRGPASTAASLASSTAVSAASALPRRAALTSREREIVQLFAEDLSTQDIADRLHLSPKTVATHRENVTHKLGVRGIAGLTRYALSEGLSAADTP